MKRNTLIQYLLRNRWASPFLVALLALMVGLGSFSNANAQSTVNIRNVIVTAGANAAATTDTYDAMANAGGTTIGGGIFAGTNFGTLDVSVGRLLLQGGTIQIVENNGETYNSAAVNFVVAPGTLTDGSNTVVTQSVPLTMTSYDASNKTRTFSFSNAGRDLLALATTAGTPGTSYRFDINVSATGQDSDGTTVYLTGARRRSQFTATGVPTFNPTLSATTVLVAPGGGANVSYDANNPPNSKPFDGANLGTFDVNNGKLLLNGGTATTRENGYNEISNVTLYYRVRTLNTGGGSFMPVGLTQTNLTTNADGSRTRTFALSTAALNLLAFATATTGYNVDIYLQASGSNSSTKNAFTIRDDNSSKYYVASFAVNGTPIATTTWTGGVNDNWFDNGNWTNHVPTAITNAVIPNFPSGATVQYPNIYSDVIKQPTSAIDITNPDGTVDHVPASPGYSNLNSGNAKVRNLTLEGSTQLDRSILRLVQGRLDVFGDFNNPQGSFIQRSGGIISFKSSGNQTISGSINGFVKVEIDGDPGSIKNLTNSFTVKSGGYLKFINGILQTNIALVSSNFISFEGASTDERTPAAQLLGESETSYFRGFLTTTQQARPGTEQNFSNVGLSLAFIGNDPGSVTVTRNTAGNYPETAFRNTKPSIRRVFGVQPTNPNTNSGGLNATVKFTYLTNELSDLRTSSGALTSDDADKLALYVSSTGGNSFSQLGRDSNVGNVLTKNGVTTFATFTLSEQQVPLPVELISFEAQRSGTNALMTWATASEMSNSGFEVQVSTDGTNFRKIAFVASLAINSNSLLKYSYLDEVSGKSGARYYRLRQIDQDGKNVFSPVRVVNFSGGPEGPRQATLTAYPNPFADGDRLTLVVQTATAGNAHLQVMDLLGRELSRQDFTTEGGITEVNISGTTRLTNGIYLAKITLATGEVKTIRIQKH